MYLSADVVESGSTYSSGSDNELDLAPGGAHESGELLSNTLKDAQSVVLGKRLEEVLDGVALVLATKVLLELGNDAGLVFGGEGWGGQNLLELCIFLEDGGKALEGLGCGVEGLRLDGGSVLDTNSYQIPFTPHSCISFHFAHDYPIAHLFLEHE